MDADWVLRAGELLVEETTALALAVMLNSSDAVFESLVGVAELPVDVLSETAMVVVLCSCVELIVTLLFAPLMDALDWKV